MKIETDHFADLPPFHDAHAHAIGRQKGGFLIALEGKPQLSYMLSNSQVAQQEDRNVQRFAVPYVRLDNPLATSDAAVVKYHARREGYSHKWVCDDLKRHPRKIALVDTLNSNSWESRDYQGLAIKYPQTQFLFCHAGGYDIVEFLKMARFLQNVWIDFSATQEIFGWNNGVNRFSIVTDSIEHAFAEQRIARKVMFGSDMPEFKQAEAVQAVIRHLRNPEDYLLNNFERLIEISGL